MGKYVHTQIPVLMGDNYEHIMCHAAVHEEGDTVTITMSAKGSEGRDLSALLTTETGELVALSFVAIPVRPRNTPS
jgi:hypothetical protein